MDEVLTWEEIERRFDGEWVVIDEPEFADAGVIRGRVVHHGPDKDPAERCKDFLDTPEALLVQVGHPTLGIPWIVSIWLPAEDGVIDQELEWDAILERFAGEWVAIAEPELTKNIDIVRGRVVYHGPSQERAFERLSELEVPDGAVEFIGSVSIPGVTLIL